MLKLFNLCLILFFLIAPLSFCQTNAIVEAKVSKDKLNTGEPFIYSVNIEGDFVSPQLTLPDFKDFIIVAQSQSRNYLLEGNKTKLVLKLNYELIAPKPGAFTIKELILKDEGREIKSKSINIEVSGAPLKDKRKIQPYISSGTDI